MKMHAQDRTAAIGERGSNGAAAQRKHSGAASMPDTRAAALEQWERREQAGNSPQTAQLMACGAAMAQGQAGGQRLVAPDLPSRATAQLQRLTRVVGGMEIDLDTISTQDLIATYKNYYLPSRDQDNYAQFGIDIRNRLAELHEVVPTLDSETVAVPADNPKYGILLGYYYSPLDDHTPAGKTHYADYEGRSNSRAHHVVLTEAGVALMHLALAAINGAKARFLRTDESYTNVYVSVNGVKWGLHLGDGRQIFPIAGQNMPEYFDS